jgi:hypothetical protein
LKRKLIIALAVLILGAIVARFLGTAIVILALICLGLGLLIGRRRGGSSKGKDIIIRIRR